MKQLKYLNKKYKQHKQDAPGSIEQKNFNRNSQKFNEQKTRDSQLIDNIFFMHFIIHLLT